MIHWLPAKKGLDKQCRPRSDPDQGVWLLFLYPSCIKVLQRRTGLHICTNSLLVCSLLTNPLYTNGLFLLV